MYKKIGIGMIVLGVSCIVFVSAMSYIYEGKLSERIIYSASDESTRPEITKTSLVAEPDFTPVTEDMKVPEVTKYVNVLEVPSCNIKVPITPDLSSYSLSIGAGHFPDTPNVGEEGNACYAGHSSSIYACIFNDLHTAKLYDEVWGYNANGDKTVYTIISKYVTTPDNISILKQYKDTKDLTLVTCTENGTMRLIFQCRELSEEALKAFKAENEKEKRDSMYAMLDDIGGVNVTHFIDNKDIPDNMFYNLPARRHHRRDSITETLLERRNE